jgi:hypothetical protein
MANRRLIAGIFLAAMLAVPAAAQDIRGEIEAALVAQGYEIVQIGRTWLGRLRVVAQNDEIRREIVVNPTTGEVLRDYSVSLATLRKPLFSDDDDNDDNDDDRPVTTAGASKGGVPEGLAADGLDGEAAAAAAAELGAAGAVESPPLAVGD